MFLLLTPSFLYRSTNTAIPFYSVAKSPAEAVLELVHSMRHLLILSRMDYVSFPLCLYNTVTNTYFAYTFEAGPNIVYEFILRERSFATETMLALLNRIRMNYIYNTYLKNTRLQKHPGKEVDNFLASASISTLLPKSVQKLLSSKEPGVFNKAATDISMNITPIDDSQIYIINRSPHISAISIGSHDNSYEPELIEYNNPSD